MSKVISIDSIEPGLILSKPIVNSFGQVLLGAGTEIQDRHIKLLKTWNIETFEVKETESTSVEEYEIGDDILEDATNKIKKRMKWQPRNKIEQDLVNMGIIFMAESITKNFNHE